MRDSTLYNMKRQTISAIDSLFACAKIMGMPHTEIVDAYHAILADRPNMPRYMREYMRGRFDVMWDSLYREHLAFGGFYKGVFYTVHSRRSDYYEKHGISPAQWAKDSHDGVINTGHYWVTTAEPKPF